MPRTIQADGRTITVPDDATPEEINQIVGPAPTDTAEKPSVWQTMKKNFNANTQGAQPGDNPVKGFVKNIGQGGAQAISGIGQMIMHPKDTADAEVDSMVYHPKATADAEVKALRDDPSRFIGNAVGQLGTGAILGDAVGKVGGAVVDKAAGAAKGVARAITKTTPDETAELVKETKAANDVSAAKAGEAKAVETKRGELQTKIHETSREAQGRIETARNNALKEGNEKYTTVNEALNPLPADMESIHGLYHEAAESLGEAQTIPTLVTRLGKALQNGAELTYKDLQPIYSELGKELSKGTLPGTVYHAYDVMQEGIGNEMQRLADSKGAGAQLAEARNYWRRMKQTFGKPQVARDAASKTLSSLSPEFARGESTANRVRLLSHYDPEIKRTAGDITEARRGLKSLPKAKSTQAVEKKVGPEEVRARKTENLAGRSDAIRNKGGGWANTFVILDAIRNAIHGNAAGIGQDIAVRGIFGGGKHLVANLLEKPEVVRLLTNPTAEDIKAIPPEMRGDFGTLAAEAAKKGIKVDPRLYAAAGAAQPRKRVASALQPQ